MLVAACGSKKERDKPAPGPVQEPAPTTAEPAPVAPPDFPEGTRSLQLTRMAPVRLDPADDGKRIGTVAIDTRVGWTRTATGKGCAKPWVEIRPRGWVCGENLKPSTKQPFGREVPLLDRGEVVPGIYGRVTGQNGNVTYTLQKPEPAKKSKGKKKRTGPVTSPSQ